MTLFRSASALAIAAAAAACASAPSAAPSARYDAEVTVTATDYKFDAPASIPAGVIKFNLENKGNDVHHVIITRIDGGHTMQEVAAGMAKGGPIPGWFVMLGGPNAVGPGGKANATVALAPGQYTLICLVSSAKDPQPHVMKGMMHELTVTSGSPIDKGWAVQADNTLSLQDFDFNFARKLKVGMQTFRVLNSAAQPHEVEIAKLAPGKSAEDLMKWLQTEVGPPPADFIGGVAPLSTGQSNILNWDVTPGNYVLICFVPDARDGKPHFAHGMVRVFTVEG